MQSFRPPKMSAGKWALFAGHILLLALAVIVAASHDIVDEREGAFWGILIFFIGVALEGLVVLIIRLVRARAP